MSEKQIKLCEYCFHELSDNNVCTEETCIYYQNTAPVLIVNRSDVAKYKPKTFEYTKESLKNILLEFKKENGRIPSSKEIKQVGSFRNYFGSWNEALLETFGEVVRTERTHFSINELDTIFLEELEKLDRVPTLKELLENEKVGNSTLESFRVYIRKYYGNYENMKKKLVTSHTIPTRKYTKEELTNILLDFKEEHKRIPISSEVFPAQDAFEREFGSWTNALLEVFKEVNVRELLTAEEIDELYIKKVNELKRLPTVEEIYPSRYDYFRSSIRSVYGKYKNLVEKFNPEWSSLVNEPYYQKFSEQELIELYRNLSNNLGRVATIKDVNDCEDVPNYSIFSRVFGGMKELRIKANLYIDGNYKVKNTKEDFIRILSRLRIKYGRNLTNMELKENNVPLTTVLRRFQTSKMSNVWKEISEKETLPKKRHRPTPKEYYEYVLKETDGEYECLEDYQGASKKIRHKHNKCGYEWSVIPNSFKRGSRCPKCAKKAKKAKCTPTEYYEYVTNETNGEYECLEDYQKSTIKLIHRHKKCGREWPVTPNNFKNRGSRCPSCSKRGKSDGRRKWTAVEYYEYVLNETNREYECLEDYKGNDIKIVHKHNKCNHEWAVSPNNFKQGARCPECSNKNISDKNIKEYYEYVTNETNGEYECLEDFQGVRVKIKHKHNKCGYEWLITPKSLQVGIGCPKCYKKRKWTAKKYYQYVKNETDGEYECLEDYQGASIKILHKHNDCGHEWRTTPAHFLEGSRCPQCSKKRKITPKEYYDYVENETNGEYECLEDYQGALKKIKHKHNKCGHEWSVTPNNIKHGSRCPSCSKTGKKNRM